MSALVTGAVGFLGSNVAAEGRRVVACDWFGEGGKWLNLRDVALHDIIRPERLASWLEGLGEPLEAVVHMGAVSATTEADVDPIIARKADTSKLRFAGLALNFRSLENGISDSVSEGLR